MFKIDTDTAVSVIPTPGAPGTPGYFRDINTDAGTPGTQVSADWLNALQSEVCYTITQADISLSKTDRTQLYTAITTLISNALTANAFSWSTITTDQDLVPRHGVVTNSGVTTLNLLLPATCAEGAVFKVVRYNGDFNIMQNDGQVIHYGDASTTPGTGGSISPNGSNASVDLLCVVENTHFVVVNSQGSFTVI